MELGIKRLEEIISGDYKNEVEIQKFLKENNNTYNKMYDINQDGKINSSDLYQIIVYLKQS